MESITGIQQRETIGRPLWEIQLQLIPDEQKTPELLGQLQNGLKNILESKMDWPGESREQEIIHVNGTHKLVQDSSFITKTANNVNFGAIIRDITVRKRAEEALHESEERHRIISELISDYVYILRLEPGNTPALEWVSGSFERITGYSAAEVEVLGGPVALAPLEDASIYRSNFERLMQGETVINEMRTISKGGETRWVQSYLRPIWDDERKRIVRVFGAAQDITGRKQAEGKIRLQFDRMRALRAIDLAISGSMDMRMSLEILLGEALSQLGADAAAVLLLNPNDPTLEYFAGKGFRAAAIHQTRIRLGDGLAGRVGLERKVLHVPNLAEAREQFKRAGLLREEEFVEYVGVPLVAKGALKGVLEIFQRSPLEADREWMNYLETLSGQAAIAIDNAQLFDTMQRSNLELFAAYDATIEGWSRAMDLRDKETEGHTQRVTKLSVQLAEKMGLERQELIHLRRGALLHDIGKLGVPDHILLKPGKLTEEEWALMKQHPVFAFEMLKPIQYLQPALDIPYCHHEKWDGSGYPRGLKEEMIPIAARIFAIADVYDALTSERPYREAWSKEAAIQHIRSERGKHFDPKVVDTFVAFME